MLKMPSIASAETQFFKQLKHTSQKSIFSYGTVILQKHLSFMESSALTQLLVCSKGNPLGRALFALAIHGVTPEVKSDLNELSSVGLEINNSKCELLIVNHTTSQERSQTTKLFQGVFPSISIPAPNLWQLLGSPLHQEAAPLHLEAKTKMIDNIIENLELIEPHQAFFMLKNCLSIPKPIYLLRSAPCFKCKEELEVFDTAIKTNMEKYAICLLEKKTGHKHPYHSDMQAWAFVPLQTCPCHASCHRLMPVRASSTVYFPFLTWKSLMGI